MKNQVLISIVLVLAAACGKDSKDKGGGSGGGGGGGGGKGGSAKVDKAKLGAECSSDFDCGNISMSADCSWSCVKPSFDAPKGYCQLQTLAATAGAKACYGNRRGVETSSSPPSDKVTEMTICDMNAGVYCNEGTHVCDAVKAIGAACEANDECGKDGACANKQCVAAGAPGAAPVEGRCASAAYKKGDQCIARVADGQACEESDQCISGNCMYGATNKCEPAKVEHCQL